jgi:hypothetical protein
MATHKTVLGKYGKFSQLFKSVLKMCVASKYQELCSIEKWLLAIYLKIQNGGSIKFKTLISRQ